MPTPKRETMINSYPASLTLFAAVLTTIGRELDRLGASTSVDGSDPDRLRSILGRMEARAMGKSVPTVPVSGAAALLDVRFKRRIEATLRQ